MQPRLRILPVKFKENGVKQYTVKMRNLLTKEIFNIGMQN